jgi:hypothetical protein
MAANGHALAGQFITFCRNVCQQTNKKLRFLFCCSIEFFQPKLLPNNEQKADEMHVTPSYCQVSM